MAGEKLDSAALGDRLERVERALERFDQVGHRIVGMLEVQTEMLTALLEAATKEPGPSPVVKALKDITEELQTQGDLLRDLPTTLASAIRDEMQREVEEEAEGDPETYEPSEPVEH